MTDPVELVHDALKSMVDCVCMFAGTVIDFEEGETETGGAVSTTRFAFNDWLKGLNRVTYKGEDLPE